MIITLLWWPQYIIAARKKAAQNLLMSAVFWQVALTTTILDPLTVPLMVRLMVRLTVLSVALDKRIAKSQARPIAHGTKWQVTQRLAVVFQYFRIKTRTEGSSQQKRKTGLNASLSAVWNCLDAKGENLDISELISKNSKLQGKDDCSRIEADGIPLTEVLREARQVPGRRARWSWCMQTLWSEKGTNFGFPFTKAAESLPQNLSETPVEINEAWSGTLPGIRFALVMRSSFVLSLLLCSAGAILLQPGPDLNWLCCVELGQKNTLKLMQECSWSWSHPSTGFASCSVQISCNSLLFYRTPRSKQLLST